MMILCIASFTIVIIFGLILVLIMITTLSMGFLNLMTIAFTVSAVFMLIPPIVTVLIIKVSNSPRYIGMSTYSIVGFFSAATLYVFNYIEILRSWAHREVYKYNYYKEFVLNIRN